MVRVKICGITNVEDALYALEEGADAIGFVFASSPRQISEDQAEAIRKKLPPFVPTVGVFVDPDPQSARGIFKQVGLDFIQLHGGEESRFLRETGLNPQKLIYTVSVATEEDLKAIESISAATVLLDTKVAGKAGGTGETFDWNIAGKAKAFGKPIVLAGGLNPDNIEKAIEIASPQAVDVSSGVESEPGKKDPGKVREFIRRAKGYVT